MVLLLNDRAPALPCYLSKGQARAGTGYPEAQFVSFSGLLFFICSVRVEGPLLALKPGSKVEVEPCVGLVASAELPDSLVNPHRQPQTNTSLGPATGVIRVIRVKGQSSVTLCN